MEALNNGILGFRELIEGGALRTGSFFSAPLKQTWHSACSQGQPEAPFAWSNPTLGWRMRRWGWVAGGWVGTCPLCPLPYIVPSLSPSRFYPVSRRAPEYYGPYASQYPDDYQYYPPGVRPDSICSMPAYDRISPPWALEDKRHAFRNGGGWKEPASYGRQDGTVWIPSPSRQPVYYDELDATSSSLRRLSLQPRSHSVPRSPSQGTYSHARIYSPVRSPSARFERLPPRSEDIYADPAAYVMRRSISSPKVSHQPSPPSSPLWYLRSLRPSAEKSRYRGIWDLGTMGCVLAATGMLPREPRALWFHPQESCPGGLALPSEEERCFLYPSPDCARIPNSV